MFYIKGFLEILQSSQACNFIKKEPLTQVFSCEFCKIFKNTFLYRTLLTAASYLSNIPKVTNHEWDSRLKVANLLKASVFSEIFQIVQNKYPLYTERKLNVRKTFRSDTGHFLKVLFKFNLRRVSRGVFQSNL